MAIDDAMLWLKGLTYSQRDKVKDWIKETFGGGSLPILVEQAFLHMPPEVIGGVYQGIPEFEERSREFSEREILRFKEEHYPQKTK